MFILNAVESVLLPEKVSHEFFECRSKTIFCTFVLLPIDKKALIRKNYPLEFTLSITAFPNSVQM